jgi:colanic acid biosynthesis glycosyl transferase WcaI
MRILILTQWFHPEPDIKGLPLAKALTARGHEVEVLTGFPNYPGGRVYPGYRLRLRKREIRDGIKVNRVALYPSHDASPPRRFLNYLSFAVSSLIVGPWMIRPPDVIYVFNLVTLGPAAFLLRLLYGSKIILDVQDLWPESVVSSGMLKSSPLIRLLDMICRLVYRRVNLLVVSTPGFKKTLAGRRIKPEKIEVIYNWCDESSLRREERDEILAENLGMAGKFNVLFAGTMGIVQGLEAVLEAARICQTTLPEVQFVFIGGGVARSSLEIRARERNLGNVRFLPRQPQAAMGKIFALADALLVHLKDHPLFRITIPSKTQAYLYMGKPIIMAVRGDSADLVRASGAGIVGEPGNPGAIAEAVKSLVSLTEEEREAMGVSGLNYYLTHLCFQRGVDRLAELMGALASDRRKHGFRPNRGAAKPERV